MSRNFYVRTHVKFTRVNEIETMYERRRVNVKLSALGSTLTFTRGLTACIVSILVTRVKITLHWKSDLRNGPYQLTCNTFNFDTALETEILFTTQDRIPNVWEIFVTYVS